MFVLVVTGKKELADDKAVLLSNAHHGLRLLKLEAGCISTLCKTGGKCGLVFLCINALVIKIISLPTCENGHLELLTVLHVYTAGSPEGLLCLTIKQLCSLRISVQFSVCQRAGGAGILCSAHTLSQVNSCAHSMCVSGLQCCL